ncbi:helix-turn-helix domain-containing protein [Chengkuizengella axinellae]|uniref:Helix-turn-helix transcriptional regulator n=1 Tax=Chengkuizengella axinellae TaxID=3064388 RepID=A0ABT9IXC2_9BACL|nr:helix-turn-helix transcriptional regulator [Chengkuizengella sp. 2205SS18-9]MDP5273991.1 helix-turn-helix transcriptional regulator [Chengkuizengella sp. 2205SS18-9]
MNKKKIGAMIQKYRKEQQLKQHELSTTTGLSRNYISDIENGRYAPSVDALLKLATALDVDLNMLKMTEIQDKKYLAEEESKVVIDNVICSSR